MDTLRKNKKGKLEKKRTITECVSFIGSSADGT